MTTAMMFVLLMMISIPLRADMIRTAGDYLQIAIPAFALGRTYGLDDPEGTRQMGTGILINLAATQGIKLSTNQTRPDGGKLSFPSGHTSAAFQGAAFIHRRYGWNEAWPHYLAASFVGYSRVHARRHYWRDVIAGSAVGITTSWLTATPKKDNEISIQASPESIYITYTRRFE